jgi:Ca-activated chloride channel family protein
MRRYALSLLGLVVWVGLAQARGIVIPVEKSIPPLAMLNHRVNVTLEDQVAITKVEQSFRNHTTRELEATYVFPVPRGASVRDFAMWVNGAKVKGELVEAAKAKQIYTEIVRRTQDPGLLEYIGQDLLTMRVFPIAPKGDQKIEVSFTSIAKRDHEVVEYTYPLKTDGKATSTLDDFTLKMTLKSQQPILNIYSPTHSISITRVNDKEAVVGFEKHQAILDKDFQVFYTTSQKDVGLTTLLHRPLGGQDGYFLMLISPRAELANEQQMQRDMVFVLDTSGSMREYGKLDQAKKALKHCLSGLTAKDRFALLNFATTVNRYSTGLLDVNKDQIEQAKQWVDKLEPTGGTAINEALQSALELRTSDDTRNFTIVFFTDGKPTIGETNPDRILTNVNKKNTTNTRIFTFGVGNDLNATLLDQLADQSRAISSFVRPDEDLEMKVSSFFGKISRPVLANLKLTAGQGVGLVEVYPPQLPDLFHGGQVIVLGRYQGDGHTAITLSGTVGKESREFVFETDFAAKTGDKYFVEDLWARRKVGYLMEQIRLNGEKKELVDELTTLAKKYGIATPYTSFLIVPDAPVPVAGGQVKGVHNLDIIQGGAKDAPTYSFVPAGLQSAKPGEQAKKVTEFARENQTKLGDLAQNRSKFEDLKLSKAPDLAKSAEEKPLSDAKKAKESFDEAKLRLAQQQRGELNINRLGVEYSMACNNLKWQSRLQQTAYKRVANRNCMELGGVWIDEGFDPKMPTVTVKAMSDAYFRILDRHAPAKEVFQLGTHLLWVTPNNTALVIDTNDGVEQLTDAEIDKLFVMK